VLLGLLINNLFNHMSNFISDGYCCWYSGVQEVRNWKLLKLNISVSSIKMNHKFLKMHLVELC